MEITPFVHRYVAETTTALQDPFLAEAIERIVPVLQAAREHDRTIYFFGNGGSASTASHLVCDVGKLTNRPGHKRYKCIALNDSIPNLTAWANDSDYAKVFSEQLATLGMPGDVAFGISGSGNSPNVLAAIEVAKERGLRTIGLTGIGGGKLKGMVEVPVVVPSNSMQHTEDIHLLICHVLASYLRDEAPAPPAR
jgi:D-sedoheptulose 7-phosphate isomerase